MSQSNEVESSPLAWLHGTWESLEAEVSYPTMDSIKYYEIMDFNPISAILLDYKSDSWNAENKSKMHAEKGFVKVQPDPGEKAVIVFLAAHNFGLTELCEGSIDGQSLHLESRFLNWMSFTKLTATKKVIRDFVLKGDTLYQTVLMETIKTPLQLHLEIKYKRMK